MDPFLKWAGGKRWLVPRLLSSIPQHRLYYEPLAGSGSLFFALNPKEAVLSDINKDLINCYRRIQRNCREVISVLQRLKPSKRAYYAVREQLTEEKDLVKRAAFFIFVNRLSWNGLYRVNRQGRFNVPVRDAPGGRTVFDGDQLMAASRMLKRAVLLCCDFEESVSNARKGDLVYFDPPYITTHLNNGFVKYNSRLFSHADELRLAAVAARLVGREVYVMVSNSPHPLIREQYDGPFFITSVRRSSSIAADAARRGVVSEMLVSSFPLNSTVK